MIKDKKHQQAIDSLLSNKQTILKTKFPNHSLALYTFLTSAYTQITDFEKAHEYSELALPYIVNDPLSIYTLMLYESLASL